jgi:hypothetical protein
VGEIGIKDELGDPRGGPNFNLQDGTFLAA